jgi:serine/threonine-protein kinase HipA
LRLVCTDPPAALKQFFAYLVLSVLVRNGDAHLKNFGVLYDDQ